MGRGKVKADCRADTRGGPWAGIPICVINSAAYRHLSLHARAILIELCARMNGWNNGTIVCSQRDIADALKLTNFRKVVSGIAELMQHGLLDVAVEGQWKERQARQYRVTFISTKGAAATNDYLHWQPGAKSGDATVAPGKGRSDATAAAEGRKLDATAASRIAASRRKSAIPENRPDAAVASLICTPYPPSQCEGADTGASDQSVPLGKAYSAAGRRDASETETAVAVRRELLVCRAAKGLVGLYAIASTAGVVGSRLVAFIEGRDLLSAPSISRLKRALAADERTAA